MRTIVEVLEEQARRHADRLAFNVAGTAIRYGELLDSVRALAGGLERLGLRAGGRCALALDTGADFLHSFLAAQWLGAAPVALNPGLPAPLLAARARRAGCDLALAEPALLPGWPGALPVAAARAGAGTRRAPAAEACDPAACAYLQLTSGTTGEPQAAVVSHAALLAYLRMAVRRRGLQDDDVFAAWVPLHHDLGLVRFLFMPLFAGAPCHLLRPSLANLREWLVTLGRERATVTGAPDFAYRAAARLVEPEGIDLGSLRDATSGGEPVRLSTIEAFESRFSAPGAIRPGYGLAEATLGVSVLRAGETLRVLPSGHVGCGRPYEELLVEIEAPDASGAGEILVRGPTLFDGYLGDPEATAAALHEGCLRTGDVGCLGPDGQLFVLGRLRAMIKRGGALIAPREVEERVDALPGVRLSAAIGLPSPHGLEDLVVVAETRGTEPERALVAAIHRAVESAVNFAPAHVLLVPARTIPRTANGKVRHAELRRMALERLGRAGGRIG